MKKLLRDFLKAVWRKIRRLRMRSGRGFFSSGNGRKVSTEFFARYPMKQMCPRCGLMRTRFSALGVCKLCTSSMVRGLRNGK